MIEILRKSYVALLVLFLALVAQIPHAAYVFNVAPYLALPVQPQSQLSAWLLAYAYAIALESATLMFVVHGHRRASYGFAGASFLVNMCYYAMHGVALWSLAAFPAWLLSALLPVAIASYSHILAGAQDEPLHWPAWAVAGWAKVRGNAPPAIADATLSPAPMQAPIAEAEPTVEDAIGDVQAGDEEAQAPLHVDPKERARQLRSEGLSNNAIAKELQVNPSTVGRWLNGAKQVA